MDENEALKILRNPYGWSKEQVRDARLAGADLIEKYRDAYLNMRKWAEENGLDTTTYNNEE